MNKLATTALFVAVPLLAGWGTASADVEERKAQSMAVIKEFASTLQGELMGAMKDGGPTNAIRVCNEVAPSIAEQQSAATGWRVGRTSLKLRSGDNAPDAWETATLKAFEERKAQGEPVGPMAHAEIVEQDGQRFFRFMKAIPVGEACLNCHGAEENIAAPIKARLSDLYPNDQATGFSLGDIRGAFTITQPM